MFSKKIEWEKKGLVVEPQKNLPWMQSHCMVPTPLDIGDGIIKLYFSGRDIHNRSNISFAIIDLNQNAKVLEYSSEPVLTPGELGCFDDNGVTPSCIIDIEGDLFLYYIGWNPGSTVRVHLFGGLAISEDNGNTFKRWSKAPILERSITDPYLNTAPWVVKKDKEYFIYYVSGCGWVNKDLPNYNIKIAKSIDGKQWNRDGFVCIDFKNEAESALARPYVIFEDGIWKMWFARKEEYYKLGYAESLDGIHWTRNDDFVNLDVSKNGPDSKMIEYAAVVKHEDRHFMFYNGNNYGVDGILLAVEE